MRFELVETRHGTRVEINLGDGKIHSFTPEDALVIADRIIELCRPAHVSMVDTSSPDLSKYKKDPICLCPADGVYPGCPVHRKGSPR
jgi:hypothetical protein